ncbi:hypothetical protein BASA83_013577 [Batrachochytrium salamandrivorans]|nr:hypothetical protein BASA83_013577 [Batrachochytrium salamandrivorans]
MPRQHSHLLPTEKGYQVRLESDYRGSFKALKKAFKDNVILTHADESQEFLVEVDASDFAVAGVLSHCGFLGRNRWLLGIPEPLLDTCRKESAHFTMADNTFCRVLENGISKIPYCPSWDRKSVYARFHRGLGHLKFDSIIDLMGVAKAVPNRDSVTVASFLYELMMNYGSPFELFTDRGSSFISEGIREYEKYRGFGIMLPLPTTHRPTEWSSACMPMGHAITTLTQGRPDRWDEYLQQTVFALRVRKHAVTKQSPSICLWCTPSTTR